MFTIRPQLFVLLALFFVISSAAFGQTRPRLSQAEIDSLTEQYLWSKDPRHLFQGADKSKATKLPPIYIDDSGAPGTVMMVSEDMYRSIREWSMNRSAKTEPLSTYLKSGFAKAEVDTFMKRFKGGDQTYFTNGTGGRTGGLTGGGGEKNGGGPEEVCRCKYLTFAPTGNQYGIVTMSPQTETQFPPFEDSGNKWEGSRTRSALGAGRAEYTRLRAWGTRDQTWDGSPVYNDAYVKMTVFYLCTDENELPDDCGCEKEIKARGEFFGDLYAQASGNTTGFPWIPGRDVKAKVEGAAMMGEYVIGPGFDSLTVPMAKRYGAFAKERVSWDPAFAIRVIDMASNLASNIATGGGLPGVKDSAIAIIKDLVTNDSIMENTGSQSGPVTMNEPAEGNLPLLPGQEKVVYMGSMTETYHEVKTGISNEGRATTYFASAFRLHITIPYNNVNPECCVEKYGMWAHGGFDLTTIYDTIYHPIFPTGIPVSYLGFTSDPTVGAMQQLRDNMITEFVGPWDSFNPDLAFGTTTYSGQACDCNVKSILELLNDNCDSVTIDISNSIFPDDYYLEITEVDDDGNFVGGWVGQWFNSLPGIINLSGPNSPLGNGSYNFQQGKNYKIKLAVNGHCTGWDAMSVIFTPESSTEVGFEVVSNDCNDFRIDISETSGQNDYFLSVREVDDQGNSLCCYQTTGWVNSLNDNNGIVSLTSITGPLGAYNFQGGKKYLVQLAVNGSCTGWIADEQVIEVPATTEPDFTVDAQCDEVTFDASATDNEDEYKITVVQVDAFGYPVPGSQVNITTGVNGWVSGDISANPNHPFDLTNFYTFSSGQNYRVTLSVRNSCTSEQTSHEDFVYSFDPVPNFTLPNNICEGDQVVMDISSAVSAEEIKIEVFLSDQFGTIDQGASVINFTQGWVNNNSPLVVLSPDPLLTVVGGEWYTVRLYARNSCASNVELMDYKSFYVKTTQECLVAEPGPVELCKADFEEDPNHTPTGSGVEVAFIDRSKENMGIFKREWSFGNGQTESKMSPKTEYTRNSKYNVTLIISDHSGCRDTVTKEVDITGIRSGRRMGMEATSSFKVYPNPASSFLNIDYSLESPARFEIMNAFGQKVRSLPLGSGQATARIGTQDLPAGMYLYRFIDGQGRVLKSSKLVLTNR
jgi:hypothetical protein